MAGYAVAAWLGARTAHGNDGIALAWPASGVALAWIAGTSPRLRPAELGLLGVLAAVAAYGMDHTVWDALNALVGVPLGLVVFVYAARTWVPDLWDAGAAGEVQTVRDYGLLLAAALLAGLLVVAVGVVERLVVRRMGARP